MTHAPTWLLLAANFDNTIRAELPAHHISFRQELNGQGGWTATLPNTGHPAITGDNLAPGRTVVWIVDPGGTPRFSGILWQHTHSIGRDNLTIRVGGTGRHGYWHRRIIADTRAFASLAPQQIAFLLLDLVEAEAPSGTLHLKDQTLGTDTYSPTYEGHDLHNVGQVIEGLAALADGGFDFDVDYTGRQNTRFVPKFTMTARRGRALDVTLDTAANFIVDSYSCDATGMANQTWVTGEGDGTAKIIGTIREPAGSYPRLQKVFPGDRVNDLPLLTARAQREARQGSACRQFITGEIYDPGGQPVVGTVQTGDTVNVRISDAVADVDERFRVTAVGVTIDRDGKETVTVDLVQDSLIVTGGISAPTGWGTVADLDGRVGRLERQQ